MAEHSDGKLIPPAEVLTAEYEQRVDAIVRAALTERILREAGFENQVAEAIREIEHPTGEVLAEGIEASFVEEPTREWRYHVKAEAEKQATSKI
jgi:hypothetical protein